MFYWVSRVLVSLCSLGSGPLVSFWLFIFTPFPLPPASRTQQLCVKLEPRGLLYVKLTLLEQWAAPTPRLSELPPPSVFGVELCRLVEKESCLPKVPLIIQKCVAEIEKRGLKVLHVTYYTYCMLKTGFNTYSHVDL